MKKTEGEMIGTNQEEPAIDKMVKNFSASEIPTKIKKIKLLEAVGLPTSKIDFLDREKIDCLESLISERLGSEDCPLIVRFACDPDKLSMPFFYIETTMGGEERETVIEKIYSLIKTDPNIKYLILQEATPTKSVRDKILGRITFEKGKIMPIQEVMEIYKGARSTNVLNNVDVDDPNFRRFIKRAGEFMKSADQLKQGSTIQEAEIREIFNLLNFYRDKMGIAQDVINRSRGRYVEDLTISFEFSYRDGRIIFLDIDF
ncbi:MAG: hypothetical protein WC348_01390 [Patescibacteria group bacterium]|jgi:hypothetical protein